MANKRAAGEGCPPPFIGVLAEPRYLTQSQPAGLLQALSARGSDSLLLDSENLASPGVQAEVVVVRGRSESVLAFAVIAEQQGTLCVNSPAAIRTVHNKARMASILARAGIRTPRTFLGSKQAICACIRPEDFPVILKPVFGDNGRGVVVARDRSEMCFLRWPEPTMIAQPLIPNDGHDLKLYVIGEEVWAVRKPSVLAGGAPTDTAEPVELTPFLKDLALRCGRLFGLELFGVDCIETPDGAVVIEVNDFPNYTAVPDASERIAEYVLFRAAQRFSS